MTPFSAELLGASLGANWQLLSRGTRQLGQAKENCTGRGTAEAFYNSAACVPRQKAANFLKSEGPFY